MNYEFTLMYYGFAYVPRLSLTKSNLLSEDSVPIVLLMSHPLEYYLGHDGNKFMDKPYLLMKPLV